MTSLRAGGCLPGSPPSNRCLVSYALCHGYCRALLMRSAPGLSGRVCLPFLIGKLRIICVNNLIGSKGCSSVCGMMSKFWMHFSTLTQLQKRMCPLVAVSCKRGTDLRVWTDSGPSPLESDFRASTYWAPLAACVEVEGVFCLLAVLTTIYVTLSRSLLVAECVH